ncbi:MAG: hypothetical protein CXR31_07420 [Geobacter sp.]|nr:MAG: hypothetical protein CXR31_07420 [Geobacter sp.]
MSMILDALRKMEQDRKIRRQGAAALRPEVLSYRGSGQNNRRNRFVAPIAGCVLVAAGICLGIWATSGGNDVSPRLSLQETRAVEVPDAQPPIRTLTPPAPIPQPSPVPAPVSPPPLPVRKVPVEAPLPHEVKTPGNAGVTISGIAWQDERELRRAVINGALVGEGAVVGGARVVEIKENCVRFSRDGQVFEVLYSSAFPLQ